MTIENPSTGVDHHLNAAETQLFRDFTVEMPVTVLSNGISNTSLNHLSIGNNSNWTDLGNMSGQDTCPQGVNIGYVYATLLVVIVSAGIVGNALSFIVLQTKAKVTNFNFLIKVLSLIDIVILVLLPIDRLMYKFHNYSSIVYWIVLWYIVQKLSGISRFASVWMLIIIAFFRYMAVCVPMKVKLYCTARNARLCVIAIFVLDVAMHIPFYFDDKPERMENSSEYSIVKTAWGNSKHYYIYAHIIYVGCMFFVLPFLSLIFFSIQMIRTLCGNQREKYFSLPHLKNEASDVTKVVIAIIVVFLISYTPYMLWTIDSFIPERRDKLDSGSCANLLYLYTFDLFLYVNSSSNFFIYLWLRPQFRNDVIELFVCSPRGGEHNSKRRRRNKNYWGTSRRGSLTMETEIST